jgi:hypothetical protein
MPVSRVSMSVLVAALAMAGQVALGAETTGSSDSYLRGYVTAVLDVETQQPQTVLGVSDGIVLLDESSGDSGEYRERVEARLADIDGVRGIEWVARDDSRLVASERSDNPDVAAAEDEHGTDLLPNGSIFEPLTADPRYPRFSIAYQNYRQDETPDRIMDGDDLDKVGSVALGGTLPIVQTDAPWEGRFEFAIQGSVFSIFDLDVGSLDLVNSDFFAGLPLSARWSWFSLMVRPYHQSSHLGDEFLLRDRTDRVDVSFEGVDGLISIDLWNWGRIYGGAGILLHRDPDTIDRRSVQAGVELTSPVAFFGGRMRPFAALDAQRAEENDYDTDYSARVGIQLENPKILRSRRLQLYGEYYKGFSPNGQFFTQRIEFFGGGLNFFF